MNNSTDTVVAGVGGFVVGLVAEPVLKFLQEPQWARDVLKNVSAIRVIQGVKWPLVFEFIGVGGWGAMVSMTYIGWRNTGVGKGDSDAWLNIGLSPSGVIGIGVYGMDLLVFYKGVPLESKTGEYVHSLPSIT